MNIMKRNILITKFWNNPIILFNITIIFLIKKVLGAGTTFATCACPSPTSATDQTFCLNSDGNLSSYAVQNACSSPETPAYTAIGSIPGVNSNEWIFISNSGNIISSSSSDNANISKGYKYNGSAFTEISAPSSVTYYLNKYGGSSQVIKVSSGPIYEVVNSKNIGNYYGFISDGGVILCTSSKSCEYLPSNNIKNSFFVNGDDNGATVIQCDSDGAPTKMEATAFSSTPYFLYKMDDENGLIDCSSGKCSVYEVVPRDNNNKSGDYASEGFYVAKGFKNDGSALNVNIVQCKSNFGCKTLYNDSIKPKVDPTFFINSGANKNKKPLIKYVSTGNPNLYSEEEADASEIYYLNGENEVITNLIYCKTKESCEIVEANENNYYLSYSSQILSYDSTQSKWINDDIQGYLVNGGANKYEKPLLFCGDTDNSCEAVAGETGGFYIIKETYSLISCSSEHSCDIEYDEIEEGYYINNQKDKDTSPLILCSESLCEPYKPNEPGYFLDQSTYYNSKYYGLIYCSTIALCNTTSIIPGFYINEGSENNEIIECNASCVSKSPRNCASITEKSIFPSGSYCYDGSVLSFIIKTFELNDTRAELEEDERTVHLVSVASDESNQANYIYTKATGDSFPGISSSLSTLFKVSKNSITQVIEDGVVAVNSKTNVIIFNFSESYKLTSSNTLYRCDSSIRECTQINSCSTQMYIYDSKNKKGFYCNGNILLTITLPGYYLDGSRVEQKKTSYVLDCDATGKCESIKPNNVYMINSGFDNDANKLIYCESGDCKTIVASNGYYLPYDQKGVIQCTSSSKCVYQLNKKFQYFINSGSNNLSKAIIRCYSGECNEITPNVGYYITHSPSILINCTSKSQCSEINASDGYYSSGYKGTGSKTFVIHCFNTAGNISCGLQETKPGLYVSNDSNVLVDCSDGDCHTIVATNGIFRSATSFSGTVISKRNENGMEILVEEKNQKRDTVEYYNLIYCDAESCRELSPSELAVIPICTFSNNQCYITNEYAMSSYATTYLVAGGYCTNQNRSKLYFATDSVSVESTVIGGTTSTFTYTTTDSNCLEVSKAYKSYYYTVGSNIYHLDDNRITQIVNIGYYFINVIENTLATGRNIDEYNSKNVKIYKCNGSSCTIIDKLRTISYFTDVNKKIIKYNPELEKYSFPYDEDTICIYNDNTCTPKHDLNKKEFCITYLGELALVTSDIKSRETGGCYKSKGIEYSIFGYGVSEYLYKMDQYSAIMVDNTAYYIVSKSSNYTAGVKDYTYKPKSIVIYGCVNNNCAIYTPKENIYYYDNVSRSMYRFKNGQWTAPEKGGYAYISISPKEVYMYKFSIKNNEVHIEKKVSTGFYYTVDKEMYECSNNDCDTITDSGYVFTNNGEIYYCEYDSEELEETVCKIQSCINGQYYYIDNYYYKCDNGNVLNVMNSKNCIYSAKYVINFPTILSDDYPSKVRYAIDRIARHNNSTAVFKNGRNYLPVVPAVYTNCTYNFEDREPTFDLLCVRNYVSINKFHESEICSVSNMGYVVCTDDSENPKKCNPSLATHSIKISLSFVIITVITAFVLFL